MSGIYEQTRYVVRDWTQDHLETRIEELSRHGTGLDALLVLAAMHEEQASRLRAKARCESLLYPKPCFLHTDRPCEACRVAEANSPLGPRLRRKGEP